MLIEKIATRLYTFRPPSSIPPRLPLLLAARRFHTQALFPCHILAKKSSTQAASQSLAPEPLSSPSRFRPVSCRSQPASSRSLLALSKSQPVSSRSQQRVAQCRPSQYIAMPPRPMLHHQLVLLPVVPLVELPQQLRPANHS